ncbi:MAG: DUF3578 domain-containing protein [Polyangiaceae bacterium]
MAKRRPAGIQVGFEEILSSYPSDRAKEVFGKKHPTWSVFEATAESMRDADPIRAFSRISIRWSAGQGRWANVPWIAALDSRETTKTSSGVYVAYLFRADMSGVYLTLNQGTSWVLAGYGGNAGAQLRKRASILRQHAQNLVDSGFVVDVGIDLRSSTKLIRSYEDSTVAFKLYESRSIPEDAKLLSDLAGVLTCYQALIPSREILGRRA